MYEFTISGSDGSNIIEHIFSWLKSCVDSVNGIIVKQTSGKTESLCLAVNNENMVYIKSCILDAVCEAIINEYKYAYLLKNITLTIRNSTAFNSFIKALVVFDRQTDKDIIKKGLILEDKLNVDSLYSFRLRELKQRWQDIASVVNESIPIMLKDKSVAEITRYFVDSTTKQVAELDLYIGENSITLGLDGKLSDLEFDITEDYIDKVLTEIISISPKKIVVHGKISNFKELEQALCSVFYNKIFVVN